jgi:fibulin 1/2
MAKNYIYFLSVTFSDIDECAFATYGGCEQICVNTAGSYICGCADGYRLAEDNKECVGR